MSMWRARADAAPVPVSLHLDHCPDRAWITTCLEAGWNSVLFDASHLDVAENTRQTIEVVAEADRHGAQVEGEIESVLGVEDGVGSDEAADVHPIEVSSRFIEDTGIYSFAPAIGTATLGVDLHETGVASAMVNTSQQIGGSVGLALLSTLSASAAANYARSHTLLPGLAAAAAIHGYTTAFTWAAGIFGLGVLLALLILPRKTGLRACSLKTALARGLAYAHHVEPADTVASPTA